MYFFIFVKILYIYEKVLRNFVNIHKISQNKIHENWKPPCSRSKEHLHKIMKLPTVKAIKLYLTNAERLSESLAEILTISGHLLITLDLSSTNITGEELIKSALNLPKLLNLKLAECRELTDTGLCQLLKKSGPLLTSVDLSRTCVTGVGASIDTLLFVNLTNLNLSMCKQLTESGLFNIIKMSGHLLKTLNLAGTAINGIEIAGCTVHLSNLEELNLACCKQLTDVALRDILSIAGLKLRCLMLESTNITGEGIMASAVHLSKLDRLCLSDCRQLTDRGLYEILQMSGSRLKVLELTRTNVTGRSVAVSTVKFEELNSILLHGCPQLTDQGLSDLLRICGPNLSSMDLGGTKLVGSSLAGCIKRFSCLKKLYLVDCEFTNAVLSDLNEVCDLTTLDIIF